MRPCRGRGPGRQVPSNSRRSKPTVGRVIQTLRTAVEQLQKESESQLAMEHRSVETLRLLKEGFGALSDAVLEGLGQVQTEVDRWQREKEALQAHMHHVLDKAQGAISFDPGDFGALQKRVKLLEGRLEGLEGDVQEARSEARQSKRGGAVEEAGPGPAEHAAAVVAAERAGALAEDLYDVRRRILEVEAQVKGLSGLENEVREVQAARAALAADVLALREQRQVDAEQYRPGEAGVLAVQAEVDRARLEQADASSTLARDIATLAEELRAVRGATQRLQADNDTRRRGAETGSSQEALHRKVQALASGQAKHIKSLDGIIKNILQDSNRGLAQTHRLQSTVELHRQAIMEQHEALERQSGIFADSLGVPRPAGAALPATLRLPAENSAAGP